MNALHALADRYAGELISGVHENFESALFYDRKVAYDAPGTWATLGHVWNSDPDRLVMRAFRTARMYLRREEDNVERLRRYRWMCDAIKKAIELPNTPVAAREGLAQLIERPIIPA